MLLPADQLIVLLQGEFARPGNAEDESTDASTRQSAAIALRLLLARERGGAAGLNVQFDALTETLKAIAMQLPVSATEVRQGIDASCAQLRTARSVGNLASLEESWKSALYRLEKAVIALRTEPAVSRAAKAEMAGRLTAWETSDLVNQLAQDAQVAQRVFNHLDEPLLEAYLHDRFADDSIRVMSLRQLSGGFGKLTYLFDVRGRDLSGSYVLRRDFGIPLVDNDCHRIKHEFEVIRAAHARGTPGPEALWLETDHSLLPGGDFIVMRRSPGVSGGSVLRPNVAIPEDLAKSLAGILARLHAQAPMQELASLNDAINADVWAMPLDQCVRRYLDGYLALYQREAHLPSPACVAQLGWLLENVPAMSGRPSLVHGDIGFHNFLIDEGRLTTVLDWEFAHVGDPAEDLASARNAFGDVLDWDRFVRCYRDAGGADIDFRRVHFFQAWGHTRNALTSMLAAHTIVEGRAEDIKLAVVPHVHVPQFLRSAQALIDQMH